MAIKRTMLAAALVGGVSALVASKATDKICGIICIEGVNKCGQPFGGYKTFSFLSYNFHNP